MSKLVYVCLRNPQNSINMIERVSHIVKVLLPDNIMPESSVIYDSTGIIIGIFNHHQSIKIRDASVCLGYINDMENWHIPNQGRPDGSFVLFRGDENDVQILTDTVASRTVWYYMDDDLFVAATSQRAITMVLGTFEFNREVIPWMLATGTLGPRHGWDRRIKRLAGDVIMTLNRSSWTMSFDTQNPVFYARKAIDEEHERQLRQALYETFSKIELDYSQWTLLLSGGVDSRGILCFLKERTGLRTVTWGLKSSVLEKSNDAYIAKQLAAHFELSHLYFETDLVDEQIGTIFYRFLTCGEGACDHISGYLDGFALWKTLYETGLRGIIRGDEGFGWVPVASPLDVRLSLGLPLWSDFSNLTDLKEFDLPEQKMPDGFLQKDGESLDTWRDRLYHEFRIPVVLGALNDLKLSYVEIIAPLLSKKIIQTVQALPDHLRTDKSLFRSIVSSVSPNIAFAKHQAVVDKDVVLKTQNVFEFLRKELTSDQAELVLPRKFLDYVLAHMTLESRRSILSPKNRIKNILKTLLPKNVLSKIKGTIAKPKMDFNYLAFRSFLIVKMYGILNADAGNSS